MGEHDCMYYTYYIVLCIILYYVLSDPVLAHQLPPPQNNRTAQADRAAQSDRAALADRATRPLLDAPF